jgi:hypothetical protein
MITSVFKKSKPINFTFVSLSVLLAVLLGYFKYNVSGGFGESSIVFFTSIFTVLVLYFIVSKNKLSVDCNYEIVLFGLFLLALPQVLQDVYVVIANLLILLAIRRILSLRSQKNVIKKVFDASLLIALASLFSFWTILFFPVVFFGLFLYSHRRVHYWLVPFLGFAAVLIIVMCSSGIFKDDFFAFIQIPTKVSFNYNSYNHLQFIVFITLLLSFSIWSSIFFLKAIKIKKKESKIAYKIIVIISVLAFVVMLISPEKNGSEFLFLIAPVVVLISSYIEVIDDKWFKELFVFMLIVIPFVLLIL